MTEDILHAIVDALRTHIQDSGLRTKVWSDIIPEIDAEDPELIKAVIKEDEALELAYEEYLYGNAEEEDEEDDQD